MPESKSHKTTANRIAKKFSAEYNTGKGADVQTSDIAIEVETPDTVSDAQRQLQGHKNLYLLLVQIKKWFEKH